MSGARERTPRPLIGVAALAGTSALLALDTGLAFARGWRPRSFEGWGTLGVLAVAVLVGLLSPATTEGRRFAGRRWAQLVLALVATALALALAEGALTVREEHLRRQQLHHRAPDLRLVFTPDPSVLPGVAPRARYSTSSLGLRGPELRPGTYRILAVGGSTTECFYLDDDSAWPSRLGALLGERTWVGAAGMAGYRTHRHLELVRESPLLDQVNAIVLLVGINDLQGDLGGEGPPRPAAPTAPAWLRLRLTRALFERIDGKAEDVWIEDTTGKFYEPRRAFRWSSPKTDQLPDLGPWLTAYRARLEAIVAAARARRVRVIFATQPTSWRAGLPEAAARRLWFGWLGDREPLTYLTPERLREALDRYDDVLVETCRALGVECVDLRSMNGDERLFYDDCHFTDAGSAEVARQLAAWIEKHAPPRDGKPDPF